MCIHLVGHEKITMGSTNLAQRDLDSDRVPNIPWSYSHSPQLLSNVVSMELLIVVCINKIHIKLYLTALKIS